MKKPIIYIAAINDLKTQSKNISQDNIKKIDDINKISFNSENIKIDKVFNIREKDINLLKDNLLEEDLEYLKKYSNQNAYFLSLTGRFLIRKILKNNFPNNSNDLHISLLENGKPYIKNYQDKDININISHSKELVTAIVYNKKCGIDIQVVSSYKKEIAERYFHKKEKDHINRINNNTSINQINNKLVNDNYNKDLEFTQIWSYKEAFIKMEGENLTKKTIYVLIK